MTTEQRALDQHIEEQLSGYIDGELTQQERQRVRLHCDQCPRCRRKLTELTELRRRMGKARLSLVGEDKWRETMNDAGNNVLRRLGWILFIAGLLVIGGIGLVAFIGDDSISMSTKLALTAAYGGLAILFVSVLRQRLRERKTDKYKDVEI
jgi:predicted anti-sigma-YlaC factor YlaD